MTESRPNPAEGGRVCANCHGLIHEDDPTTSVRYPAGNGWTRHFDCRSAAYQRGRRDGYEDAVRQIKLATHALKRGGRSEDTA